jgi:septal ring factor EnvC (AmiA/AmiB activator)
LPRAAVPSPRGGPRRSGASAWSCAASTCWRGRAPLQRLLEGASPGELQRELVYLDHLARDRARTLGELHSRGEELAELQAQSEIKQIELAAVAEDEARNRAELLKQQAARSRTLDRLARQLAGQQRSLQTLQRDERRLGLAHR